MNRFNPFIRPVIINRLQPVQSYTRLPQPISSPIDQLPAYAKRLILSVWNDRNALGLLTAMWGSAIVAVRQDTRPGRDPNTIPRMMAVLNQMHERLNQLPRTESTDGYNERPADWDDYAF